MFGIFAGWLPGTAMGAEEIQSSKVLELRPGTEILESG